MSKRRKLEQIEKKKRKTRLAILASFGLALLVGAIGFGIWWRFVRIKPVTSFIPRDLVSLIVLNIDEQSDQVAKSKDLGEAFGSREFFPGLLQDIILPVNEQYIEFDKEEIKLWFGTTIAIGKLRTAGDAIDIVAIDIKNEERAKEFTDFLTTSLTEKGRAVSEETFRGHVITSIEGGEQPIHFTLLPNHILVSERIDGVRLMLDAERGRVSSVDEMKEFRRAQRRVKDTDDAVAFFMLDVIEVIRLLPKLTSQLDPELIAGVLDRGSVLNLFGTIQVEREGAYLNFFIGEETTDKRSEKLKPRFAQLVPKDTLLFLEGSDMQSFAEGLIFEQSSNTVESQEEKAAISYYLRTEMGLDYEEDVMGLFAGQYAIALLPEGVKKEEIPLAIFLDVEGEKDIPEKLGKMEQAVEKIVNDTYPNDDGRRAEFTTHDIEDNSYHFLNLPDDLSLDLAIAQFEDTIVLTSTDVAMEQLLELQALPEDSRLSNHPSFEVTLKDVERSDMTRVVYIDTQDFLRFAADMNALDYGKLRDDYKVPDEFVGVTWQERVGSTTRGFLNIF